MKKTLRRSLLFAFGAALLLTTRAAALAQDAAADPFAKWEKAIATMEAQDLKNKPPQGGILFVGSSSIRLWNLSKSFPEAKAINRGFGGSEIADSIHFADRIVMPHQPRKVFLYAGDNDISKGKSAKVVARDYLDFVKVVHGKLPKTEIYFIAIKPSIKRWNLVGEMREANEMIKAECNKNELLGYVDIDTPMIGSDGMPRPELFAKDGLHLNEVGYEVWSKVVEPFLEK
jgi:lysophospholipase L1-like esterase